MPIQPNGPAVAQAMFSCYGTLTPKDPMSTQLTQEKVDALKEAETLFFHCDFCPYLELKELLRANTPAAQERFSPMFWKYYVFNPARLPKEFKKQYFTMLFGRLGIEGEKVNFHKILTRLYEIPPRKLHFSFASKLAAIHLESSPLYDKHVAAFFGENATGAGKGNEERINWFEGFLAQVQASYEDWAADARVTPLLEKFKSRDPRLQACHVVRLMDFLVWKVGNQKLLAK